MTWVTAIWSMQAGACLTLAAIHLVVWQQTRSTLGNLFFALGAIGAAGVALCELLLMHTDTIERYGSVMWWAQTPVWVLIVSVVLFTRSYVGAGRPLLAWAAIGTRTLTLLVNFFSTPNLIYASIHDLRHVAFLGETITIAEGAPNPLSIVGKLSSLLLLVFLVDASIEVWRRGERNVAVYLGGSMIFFIAVAAVHTALVERGLVESPYLISFAFFGVVSAMAYEVGRGTVRAAQLGRELQASELRLRDSEERMVLAADAANLGVWIHDFVHHEIWASDGWRALFGFSQTERIDFDAFVHRIHPNDRDAVRALLASPTEPSYDREYRLVLPDGQVRWIASRGRVEFGADGKPMRRRGASLDITERKRAELKAELHGSEAAHLSRVAMFGEIAGSLAHELNQPLAAILANTEAASRYLQRTPDATEVREILADIRSDSIRAAAMVQGARAFLRRQDLDMQPRDVAELIGEAMRMIRADTVAREVVVVADIPPGIPRVQGDRVHLQHVLLNLLVNGMDAVNDSPAPDRRIEIRAACSDARAVEITITDAGVGIPADRLEQVFESFYTTKPRGLGLGLSICRTIVEAHRGSIVLKNNTGRGATALVRLPACEAG